MNTQRLINSNFINSSNDALVNSLLAKFGREQDSRDLVKLVDKTRYSRQHNALVIAVMVLDQQNTAKKLVDEKRNCHAHACLRSVENTNKAKSYH
jgi:hypothetical protein